MNNIYREFFIKTLKFWSFITGVSFISAGQSISYTDGIAEAICGFCQVCQFVGFPFYMIIIIIGVILVVPFWLEFINIRKLNKELEECEKK